MVFTSSSNDQNSEPSTEIPTPQQNNSNQSTTNNQPDFSPISNMFNSMFNPQNQQQQPSNNNNNNNTSNNNNQIFTEEELEIIENDVQIITNPEFKKNLSDLYRLGDLFKLLH